MEIVYGRAAVIQEGGVTPCPPPPLCVIQWSLRPLKPARLCSCACLEDRVRVSMEVKPSLTDGEVKNPITSRRVLITRLSDVIVLPLRSDEKEPQGKQFVRSFVRAFILS